MEGLSEALALEIKPLGLKVTIVEPGGFRTDWAGASMAFAKPIEAYAPTIGFMREQLKLRNGNQPGDPRKAAQVIVKLIDMPDRQVNVWRTNWGGSNKTAPMHSVSYYLEFQKQLSASKGPSRMPLVHVRADQELNSLRSGRALVGVGAIDEAKKKPPVGCNSLTPLDIRDALAEASTKMNFDWPGSLPIERIKAGLTEIAWRLFSLRE